MPVLFLFLSLFLILAGNNGIVVWDWNQGQPRERRLRMEPVSAVGLAMAPDGRHPLLGYGNGWIEVLRLATGPATAGS
jgi:hypothetical protein